MAEHSTHIRHVLLYEFESGHPVAEAHRNLSQVFGPEAPSERFVHAWFQRFKTGTKKLEDESRSGRPTAISFDEQKNLAEQHPYEGLRYSAASLGSSLSTVSNGLRSLGMVKKLGSSSGIGAGTAVLFAKEGAKVTITGRKKDGLAATKKAMLEVGANEDHINVVATDVTDALGREELITSTIRKFGQLDILVNNAGAAFSGGNGATGLAVSTEVLDRTMKLNVNSVIELIQLARPHLVKSKGEIVNVSSIAGLPAAHSSVPYYAMAKAALDQMMRALAIELIAEGVRVNNVK
ncbi:oxidoreductase, short chain dehydrogenase/reductase family protein [Necator americanus]|uniref:Oxidoreductase, short chain dehydrogenase/reductase family protein n=1 Tax=Necator americanus TaxID=51031 RepID=W2SJM0_NECAM|nr:oxidoreductase, short chain dehydrogenase/reductase family protein [Necator americanus]ETN69780.1 oxidoreductase, short chain dehydrogenase/reductase family protein [Necator americanus]